HAVLHLALSPDGKQFATTRWADSGVLTLAAWDSASGRPVREQKVNAELFKGFVCGPRGAFAVSQRAAPKHNGNPARLHPAAFRVWDCGDPTSVPPMWPVQRDWGTGGLVVAKRPGDGVEYTEFRFSAHGQRVAALRTGDGKFAVRGCSLTPARESAKL